MKLTKVTPDKLKLGDKVAAFDGPYNTSTVIRIDELLVQFQRPYLHFDESVNVCYTGIEQFTVYRHSDRTYDLWEAGS